eukprot:TRINITY_DN1816_c0_g3_i2.p1 TRINITY_DN1816_c0_g3~~TRINITY_DN1816_c0_g3_i2.p1  ORF type:complete len:201 (+),score=106.70 TRINITY_DN1816_c0_g3_i2:113-715(+)
MCFKVKCKTCQKWTWGGCGNHIEQALSGVKKEDRCTCKEEKKESTTTTSSSSSSTSSSSSSSSDSASVSSSSASSSSLTASSKSGSNASTSTSSTSSASSSTSSASSSSSASSVSTTSSSEEQKNPLTLVYFIGGVTFAEISALRFLADKEGHGRDYIIATTKLINGQTLMDSLVEPVANNLKSGAPSATSSSSSSSKKS